MSEGGRWLVLLGLVVTWIATGCSDPPNDSDIEDEASPSPTASSSLGNVGSVEVVEVEAVGFGATRGAAIQDAAVRAIEEVHGRAVAMAVASVSVEAAGLDAGQRGEAQVGAQVVASATSGFVTTLRVLEEGEVSSQPTNSNPKPRRSLALILPTQVLASRMSSDNSDGQEPKDISDGVNSAAKEWQVRVRAGVAKYAPRSSAPLAILVSVAGREAPSATLDRLEQTISSVLVRTDRATVVARDESEALTRELDLALSSRSNAPNAARYGQNRVADLAVLVEVDDLTIRESSRPMRTTNRVIKSASGSASVSFRLVDVATLEVLGMGTASSSRQSEPGLNDPDIAGWETAMAEDLADQVGRAVSEILFPIRVIDITDRSVTLNAGAGRLDRGTYDLFALGEDLADPETGQVLGRRERKCCTVTVDRVTERLAFGQLSTEPNLQPGEVLELRQDQGRR